MPIPDHRVEPAQRVPNTAGHYVKGVCRCGWTTPGMWAAVAGADNAVRRHITEQTEGVPA